MFGGATNKVLGAEKSISGSWRLLCSAMSKPKTSGDENGRRRCCCRRALYAEKKWVGHECDQCGPRLGRDAAGGGSISKTRKEGDVTKELMDDAARRAAKEVMMQMARDNEMHYRSLEFSLTNAVNPAEAGLNKELRGRMAEWESQLQQQWVHFERKWEDHIVEGTIFIARHRVQNGMHQT